jgi:hypothetical protein
MIKNKIKKQQQDWNVLLIKVRAELQNWKGFMLS